MERILVGINATRPSWEALLRALCLAPRIQARLAVLAVFTPSGPAGLKTETGQAVRRRVESEIEAAKAAGANVELFLAEGNYEHELISAAMQLKTTLLVAAAASGEDGSGEREAESLNRIINGVSCRVELVSPRKPFTRR